MKTRELVNNWLMEFCHDKGISHLELDTNGICAIHYSDALECVLECPSEAEVLYFYAPMGAIQQLGKDVFTQVLKANFFCLETHGATFCIDPSGERILLCYPQPTPLLDSISFGNVLENFLEIALVWYNRLNGIEEPEPEAFGQKV
jgi:hypothetical protein